MKWYLLLKNMFSFFKHPCSWNKQAGIFKISAQDEDKKCIRSISCQIICEFIAIYLLLDNIISIYTYVELQTNSNSKKYQLNYSLQLVEYVSSMSNAHFLEKTTEIYCTPDNYWGNHKRIEMRRKTFQIDGAKRH